MLLWGAGSLPCLLCSHACLPACLPGWLTGACLAWACRLTHRWEASLWLHGRQLYLGGFNGQVRGGHLGGGRVRARGAASSGPCLIIIILGRAAGLLGACWPAGLQLESS